MKTGLTLGKFAPLHKGHQLVIETALAEVDHLVVLIYDSPEVIELPLAVRAGWIRDLYPKAEVIEVTGGPTAVGNTPEIQEMHERFILGILGERRITHFYSSEFYGEHMSRALGAVDRRVDPGREKVPVSGTLVRAQPFENRGFLHARVYWDLVRKAVFLGAPSTGKSTLAETCARMFRTAWVPEYGREYWEQHQVDRRLSLEQLVEIAEAHRAREMSAVTSARNVLFVDTDASTTAQFSRYYHRRVHPELDHYEGQCRDRYDIFFLCDTDIPYEDTWDRSGAVNREDFQRAIIANLEERGIQYHLLTGSIEERIHRVKKILECPAK